MRFFILMAIYASCLAPCTLFAQQIGSDAKEDSTDTKKSVTDIYIGKELRAAIDVRYDELKKTNGLKNNGRGHNSISDTVLKYIPLGTSFDRAESILSYAGFKIGGHEKEIGGHDFVVHASIDKYVFFYFEKISVVVILHPINSNDWTAVHELDADIVKDVL